MGENPRERERARGESPVILVFFVVDKHTRLRFRSVDRLLLIAVTSFTWAAGVN